MKRTILTGFFTTLSIVLQAQVWSWEQNRYVSLQEKAQEGFHIRIGGNSNSGNTTVSTNYNGSIYNFSDAWRKNWNSFWAGSQGPNKKQLAEKQAAEERIRRDNEARERVRFLTGIASNLNALLGYIDSLALYGQFNDYLLMLDSLDLDDYSGPIPLWQEGYTYSSGSFYSEETYLGLLGYGFDPYAHLFRHWFIACLAANREKQNAFRQQLYGLAMTADRPDRNRRDMAEGCRKARAWIYRQALQNPYFGRLRKTTVDSVFKNFLLSVDPAAETESCGHSSLLKELIILPPGMPNPAFFNDSNYVFLLHKSLLLDTAYYSFPDEVSFFIEHQIGNEGITTVYPSDVEYGLTEQGLRIIQTIDKRKVSSWKNTGPTDKERLECRYDEKGTLLNIREIRIPAGMYYWPAQKAFYRLTKDTADQYKMHLELFDSNLVETDRIPLDLNAYLYEKKGLNKRTEAFLAGQYASTEIAWWFVPDNAIMAIDYKGTDYIGLQIAAYVTTGIHPLNFYLVSDKKGNILRCSKTDLDPGTWDKYEKCFWRIDGKELFKYSPEGQVIGKYENAAILQNGESRPSLLLQGRDLYLLSEIKNGDPESEIRIDRIDKTTLLPLENHTLLPGAGACAELIGIDRNKGLAWIKNGNRFGTSGYK